MMARLLRSRVPARSRVALPGALSLVVLALSACGGEQRAAGAAVDSAATAATPEIAGQATPRTDTAPTGMAPDTVLARDTASVGQAPDTAKSMAAKPAPKRPARKVVTAAKPAPKTSAPDTSATQAPAESAQAAPTAQAPATPAPTAQAPAAQAPSGGAPLRDAYHQAPRDTVSQVAYTGWKQFNLNCARCHGEDVEGTTIAPHLIVSLKPNGPINTKELFVQTVCAGRVPKGMPAWCALGMDPQTIEAIYTYVKGRSDGKIGPGRPAVKAAG